MFIIVKIISTCPLIVFINKTSKCYGETFSMVVNRDLKQKCEACDFIKTLTFILVLKVALIIFMAVLGAVYTMSFSTKKGTLLMCFAHSFT